MPYFRKGFVGMGYTTYFSGEFELNKPLDDETFELLNKLAETRRMKRDPEKLSEILGITKEQVIEKYGIECDLYTGGGGFMGQDHDASIVNYNNPPSSQPGLRLQWVPTEDRMFIVWDEGEKFYYAEEWIRYLIDIILSPKGYVLNGKVKAQGEDYEDIWAIVIKNNEVTIFDGKVVFEPRN